MAPSFRRAASWRRPSGEIPRALGQVASDLLATEPDIRPIDVIAVK